jgi:hypothetical protein
VLTFVISYPSSLATEDGIVCEYNICIFLYILCCFYDKNIALLILFLRIKDSGKVTPALIYASLHEDVWEIGDTAPHIPNLDTRWW